MKRAEIAYKEELKKIKIKKEAGYIRLRSDIINDASQKNNIDTVRRFKNICKETDGKTACQLLDKGYGIGDVQRSILKSSLFGEIITDEKVLQNYCDDVMNEINKERMLRSGKVYEITKASYLEKSAAIQDKYSNTIYSEYQEGKVVISLMREHGFFPEVIEAVLQKHSRSNANDEYVKKIIEGCTKVKENYLLIDAANQVHVQSAADCYRLFAKEYMKKTDILILNGRDEQKIITRMFAQGISEEFIMQALASSSPVAIEPGRTKENYIETIMTATKENYKKKKEFAQKNYPETVKAYENKIEALDKGLKEKGHRGVDYNQSYYDGIVVKEMLGENFLHSNIEKAIAEKSPQASKPNPLNPNKTPEGYAKWIRRRAQDALAAEKSILDFERKPLQGTSYQKLTADGVTAIELYKNVISERISTYPSIATKLSAGFIDKDACEKILQQYPDIKINHLKEAIREVSPRAKLPGIPESYPDLVIENTNERKEQAEKSKASQMAVQAEYMKQCGLATEGVDVGANMLMYHDGRAVLEMLQNGTNQAEIKSAIVSGIKVMRVNIDNPEKYADTVIEKSEIVRKRIETIQQHQEEPQESRMEKPKEFYLRQLHDYEKKFNYVSSKMDIAIAAAMLLKNFKTAEVVSTVKEFSPTAAEPGRDDKYVSSFVIGHANERIRQEKLKLKDYTVIPRIDRAETPEQEYVYHLNKLQSDIRLPISESMDLMIAKAMLAQGFKEKEIINGLAQSPCAKKKKNYGIGIAKAAASSLDKTKENGRGLGKDATPY